MFPRSTKIVKGVQLQLYCRVCYNHGTPIACIYKPINPDSDLNPSLLYCDTCRIFFEDEWRILNDDLIHAHIENSHLERDNLARDSSSQTAFESQFPSYHYQSTSPSVSQGPAGQSPWSTPARRPTPRQQPESPRIYLPPYSRSDDGMPRRHSDEGLCLPRPGLERNRLHSYSPAQISRSLGSTPQPHPDLTSVDMPMYQTDRIFDMNGKSESPFQWDIMIARDTGRPVHAVAMLDTGCKIGNWISDRLARTLQTPIEPIIDGRPRVKIANGHSLTATGRVTIHFRRQDGHRFHECQLYVFPHVSDHLDVIFGLQYIVQEDILFENEYACLPLVPDRRPNKDDEAVIADAKEKARQEREAREQRERRRRLTQQGGSSQQAQDQQGRG